MEVEDVQSRCASVVLRSGQNMSVAQTAAAIPGSITPFFFQIVHEPHLCLLVLKLSQQGLPTSQPRHLLLRPAQQ